MTSVQIIFLAAGVIPLVLGIGLLWAGDAYSDRRFTGGVLVGIAAIVLLSGGGVLLAERVNHRECRTHATQMGRDYRHDMWGGCLIQTDDGQYVPDDNLRINEDGGSR